MSLYAHFGKPAVPAPFIQGGANLVHEGWGLPNGAGNDTAGSDGRIVCLAPPWTQASACKRYIIQEWGAIYRIPLLNNGIIATLLAVTACLLLAFGVRRR